MKKTLSIVIIIFALLFSIKNYSQNIVTKDDLQILLGKWTGTLTYIDYSSNKPYTMPANLIVEQGKNENQILLFNNYPNEPKANSKDKIKISKNGELLDNKKVKSKEKLADNQIQIITEYSGKDNKKKALIRNIYIIGEKQFVIRKEVKFNNSEEWIVRNKYSYNR